MGIYVAVGKAQYIDVLDEEGILLFGPLLCARPEAAYAFADRIGRIQKNNLYKNQQSNCQNCL